MEDIREKLQKVFLAYSICPGKGNESFLKMHKFKKLIADSGALGSRCDPREVELIFYAQTRHRSNMSFELFLESLPKLAKQTYSREFAANPGNAMKKLIDSHFLPLYETMCNQSVQEIVDSDSMEIFMAILPSMTGLYHQYYAKEFAPMSSSELTHISLATTLQFLKDFDIFPTLVGKAAATRIWKDIVSGAQQPLFEPDLGQVFTLSKFCIMILQIAVEGYKQDAYLNNSPNAEKLLMILERMELSPIMENEAQRKGSFLPKKELIEKILWIEMEGVAEFEGEEDEESKASEAGDAEEMAADPLDPYIKRMHQIFQAYCSMGESLQTNKLKTNKLIKMLKDASLFRSNRSTDTFDVSVNQSPPYLMGLSSTDIDLILAKVNRNNSNLSFNVFIQFIETIAVKMNPKLSTEAAFKKLVEECFVNLDNEVFSQANVDSIEEKMNMIQEPEIIEALGMLHRSIIFFYRCYADGKGYMKFDAFIRFCREFSLFPDIISKQKLLKIFFALANIQNETEAPQNSISVDLRDSPESDAIDEHLFVEALALVAVENSSPQDNALKLICHLVERMAQSNGPERCMKANRVRPGEQTDILGLMKARYPEVFEPVYQEINFDMLCEQALQDF